MYAASPYPFIALAQEPRMSEIRSHLQIVLAAIHAYSNDGKFDASEVEAMAAIAQRDGKIDTDEARVLRDIIDKLTDAEMTPEMEATVAELRKQLPALA